jgi:hypothetical protein
VEAKMTERNPWDVSFWNALLVALVVGLQTFALLMSKKKIGGQKAEALRLHEAFIRAQETAKLEQNQEAREAAARETARLSEVLVQHQAKMEALEKERAAHLKRVEDVVSWDELFAKEVS